MKLGGIYSVVLAACAVTALAGCPNQAKNDSLGLLQEANEFYKKTNYEQAIPKYEESVARWAENHTAFYGLSGSYYHKKNFAKAAENAKKAVNLVPDQAMYQLWCGRMLYERAKEETLKAQAGTKDPSTFVPDYSHAPFDDALGHLQEAVKLNTDLWRAHFLIGNIYYYQQKPKDAAAELTKALESAPKTENAPWITLAELYRQWDYPDAAIQVATQGVQVVHEEKLKSDLYYEIGAGHDDKRSDAEAIKNFKLALETAERRGGNQRAKFMLGQALYRKGDYTEAKPLLEQFANSTAGGNSFFKEQASRMFQDIQMRQATPGGGPTGGPTSPGKKMSPEETNEAKEGKDGKK